jgi:EAL and modified HD-GYP domain-containing signal transduction protein
MALRGAVVVEVPAGVLAEPQTVAALRDCREAGFRVAVQANDDDPGRAALYTVASSVRFDLARGDAAEPADGVPPSLSGAGYALVASGVDSMARFGALRAAGVHSFAGRFFTAPEAVVDARLPVSFGTVTRLLAMLEQAELSDRAIEQVLRADPALSLKLLRMVNSAASGVREVGSILHAIQIIGRNGLQRWLALLAVEGGQAGTALERERRLWVLERARMCELIAEGIGLRRHANSVFLTGMLSAIGPMMGASPLELTDTLHVNRDVADALAGRGGLYAPVVDLASAYAVGDWRTVRSLGQPLGVCGALAGWYRSAVGWARDSLARA